MGTPRSPHEPRQALGPVTNLPDMGGERLVVQDKLPLAVVVKLVNARWEMTGDAAPVVGRTLPSGRLRLRSGMATLAYVNGVMLTLEGPADVDLISVDRVFCRQGKLRSRVPKGAEGFVIASPSSAVVNLGTELALNVDADGQARIMVFEGAAEAALLSESGTPRRSQIVEKSQAFDLESADRPDRGIRGATASGSSRPPISTERPEHRPFVLLRDHPVAAPGLLEVRDADRRHGPQRGRGLPSAPGERPDPTLEEPRGQRLRRVQGRRPGAVPRHRRALGTPRRTGARGRILVPGRRL